MNQRTALIVFGVVGVILFILGIPPTLLPRNGSPYPLIFGWLPYPVAMMILLGIIGPIYCGLLWLWIRGHLDKTEAAK